MYESGELQQALGLELEETAEPAAATPPQAAPLSIENRL
jgi:hypothetical protein